MRSSSLNTVLIFTDWYLPGYKAGGPIRSMANLVETLGDAYHFKIVCGDRDYMDTQPYEDIDVDTWTNLGKADVYYLGEADQNYRSIKRLIREERPAIVYINGLFSKVFSIFPLRAARRLTCRTIVAPRGMLAPGALGIKSGKKELFLKLSRLLGLYRNVVFHATHSHEVGHIRKAIAQRVEIVEVPNLPGLPERVIQKNKPKGYLHIAMVARIAPEKNILYALECFSKLASHFQVRVDFVGPVYDGGYFEKCVDMTAKLPVNIKVFWEGPKAHEEIKSYYEKAHLFFLPTLGENFGHAILEAMLAGLPVLISDQTPWRNLEGMGLGKDVPLSDQEGFVEFISSLAEMDSILYQNCFGSVATKAADLVKIPELISGYEKLFG